MHTTPHTLYLKEMLLHLLGFATLVTFQPHTVMLYLADDGVKLR